jgi:hypothetical protein
MIRLADIRAYLDLKERIAAAVLADDSAFIPSQRECSEGLARSIEVGGQPWTYAAQDDGYAFTNRQRRFSVLIRPHERDQRSFSGKELSRYLQCYTTTEDVSELVVDNWLAQACRQGHMQQVCGGGTVRYRLLENG